MLPDVLAHTARPDSPLPSATPPLQRASRRRPRRVAHPGRSCYRARPLLPGQLDTHALAVPALLRLHAHVARRPHGRHAAWTAACTSIPVTGHPHTRLACFYGILLLGMVRMAQAWAHRLMLASLPSACCSRSTGALLLVAVPPRRAVLQVNIRRLAGAAGILPALMPAPCSTVASATCLAAGQHTHSAHVLWYILPAAYPSPTHALSCLVYAGCS